VEGRRRRKKIGRKIEEGRKERRQEGTEEEAKR
jgi:hypothetical protein